MTELINDIISTGVGGAAAGLALYGVQFVHQKLAERRDSKTIFKWLESQGWASGCGNWRSTRAIASYTNLTEDRVRYICSRHPEIFLSTGHKDDMWGKDRNLIRAYDDLPD